MEKPSPFFSFSREKDLFCILSQNFHSLSLSLSLRTVYLFPKVRTLFHSLSIFLFTREKTPFHSFSLSLIIVHVTLQSVAYVLNCLQRRLPNSNSFLYPPLQVNGEVCETRGLQDRQVPKFLVCFVMIYKYLHKLYSSFHF